MILPNLALKQVSAPAIEPVTLAEAKEFLRITGSADDALINSLIIAVTRKTENYLNRFLITQTWNVTIDHIPLRERDSRDLGGSNGAWWDGVKQGAISSLRSEPDFFHLPRGPVQSVTTFTVFDRDDVSSLFTNFNLDKETDAARIFLKIGSVWPTNLRDINAIQLKVIYGFGSATTDVPSDITTAIKILLFEIYEDRGCDVSGPTFAPNGKASSMNKNAACLLDAYTIERLE